MSCRTADIALPTSIVASSKIQIRRMIARQCRIFIFIILLLLIVDLTVILQLYALRHTTARPYAILLEAVRHTLYGTVHA
jgi:hypothetical protein